MPPRKRRIPVVFDTNVVVGFYLSRDSIVSAERQLRDLPIVLRDFRTQVQNLAARLEIEGIEVESDMAGQPDVTKMAIAMAVEELSAHYKSLPDHKKAEIEEVIAELEIRHGHHPRIAEIIRHLREDCQSAL